MCYLKQQVLHIGIGGVSSRQVVMISTDQLRDSDSESSEEKHKQPRPLAEEVGLPVVLITHWHGVGGGFPGGGALPPNNNIPIWHC